MTKVTLIIAVHRVDARRKGSHETVRYLARALRGEYGQVAGERDAIATALDVFADSLAMREAASALRQQEALLKEAREALKPLARNVRATLRTVYGSNPAEDVPIKDGDRAHIYDITMGECRRARAFIDGDMEKRE